MLSLEQCCGWHHYDADSDPGQIFDVDDLDWHQKDAVPHADPTQVSHKLENLNF
jgi:hypothetical protein